MQENHKGRIFAPLNAPALVKQSHILWLSHKRVEQLLHLMTPMRRLPAPLQISTVFNTWPFGLGFVQAVYQQQHCQKTSLLWSWHTDFVVAGVTEVSIQFCGNLWGCSFGPFSGCWVKCPSARVCKIWQPFQVFAPVVEIVQNMKWLCCFLRLFALWS